MVNFMDIVLFAARHAPFWGIPMSMISAELVLIMWTREKRMVSIFFSFCAIFGVVVSVFYFYIGGPEKFVKWVIQTVQYYG